MSVFKRTIYFQLSYMEWRNQAVVLQELSRLAETVLSMHVLLESECKSNKL